MKQARFYLFAALFAAAAVTAIEVQTIREVQGLGAEIHDVDISTISDADFDTSHRALLDHGVVVFRNQGEVPLEALRKFMARFGRLHSHVVRKLVVACAHVAAQDFNITHPAPRNYLGVVLALCRLQRRQSRVEYCRFSDGQPDRSLQQSTYLAHFRMLN